jgi:uncharacterized protein involved in exopolysaccharide biosynthesis
MENSIKNRESTNRQDEIEFKDIIKTILKRKWWLVCTAVLVLILELLYTFMNHKDYLLILNIAVAVFFSIIIGVVFVLVVEAFSRYKFRKKSENSTRKD